LPVLIALGSASLFGLSTPVAKLLLGEADPWILAGLLYGGAGVGLLIVYLFVVCVWYWRRCLRAASLRGQHRLDRNVFRCLGLQLRAVPRVRYRQLRRSTA